MKGISVQFDNLVGVLQKNITNKDLLQSKDNFELVYQKVTQQTFKTVSVIIDNLSDDITVKQSFSKLLKQLKNFLSLKPISSEDDEDEYYNNEFDEVKQFMNSRKPVMNDLDTGQRGDIYKFLHQAENKEKDIQEFMGNMNKFNPKGGKKFESTNSKWKKTLKNISVITEDIIVQTDLTMQVFQKLQDKFPTLFQATSQSQDTETDTENNANLPSQEIDIQAKIQQIVKQRLQQQKAKALQEQSIKQQNQAKQKENQRKKKEAENKKKKLNPVKRNSQINQKRSSNVSSLLKPKSQFTNKKQSILNGDAQKLELLQPITEQQTKTGTKQDPCVIHQSTVQNSSLQIYEAQNSATTTIDNVLSSFERMSQTLSGLKDLEGVSSEQVKIIYEALQKQLAQRTLNSQVSHISNLEKDHIAETRLNNQKYPAIFNKKTEQKQVNTILSYLDENSHHEINQLNIGNQKSKFMSQDQCDPRVDKCHPSYSLQIQNQDSSQKQRNQQLTYYHNQSVSESNSNSIQNSHPNHSIQNRQNNKSSNLKNVFPQISKYGQFNLFNKVQGNDSTNLLAKQGKSAEQYLSNMRDTKYIKSLQNSKVMNKQNYSLDMYKTKDNLPKNRGSQHVNLPSLNRNTQNRVNVSLHEQINESGKSPYLKKSSKKTIHHPTTTDCSSFVDKDRQNIHELGMKKNKKDKIKDVFKEEERIIKQLERICIENSVKSNLKNIAMYITFVQSTHLKRCGQKCIHLQRFYDFLNKNNLPNRKELQMHKTDMNINVNL